MSLRLLLAATSFVALCACTATLPTAADTARPATGTVATASAHDALFALFKESDEASLKLNPLNALLRGDMRYADQFGDYLSDEYFQATRASLQDELARLHAIDRAGLSETDRLAYDVFEHNLRDELRGTDPDILALTAVRPINHFSGMQGFYPTVASGKGAAPFTSVDDYRNNLKRNEGYARYLDAAIVRFRQGLASGVVDTRLTTRNMIEQFGNQLSQPVGKSQFYAPAIKFPSTVPAAEQTRLRAEFRAQVETTLYPAMRRMRDFLRTEYLPKAREANGLSSMKGGDTLYRYLAESSTTLPADPEAIHQLGLNEVARILTEMEKVRTEVGFKGSQQQFFDYLRTDAKFQPKSREELTQGYYAIGKKVETLLPTYFSTMPKSKLEIRPYDPTVEKFQAGGSYEQGTPDGSRPGVFYFNAYDLPSRTTPGMTTLFLHEGSPGHHFQISLAQENEALPAFMRFDGNTAFIEGWALYAETLGYDMGLYKDPYQRMGTLSDEMLRAMRLVVDTGIHAKGWTREQSIEYMLANSNMGRTDATAEVERYIAIPGQALAYKIGALTIQRLRRKAEAELGPRFDIREFHAQVLMTGALPLTVLEQKIDRWIAAKKG